jgi:hypothetical protein
MQKTIASVDDIRVIDRIEEIHEMCGQGGEMNQMRMGRESSEISVRQAMRGGSRGPRRNIVWPSRSCSAKMGLARSHPMRSHHEPGHTD